MSDKNIGEKSLIVDDQPEPVMPIKPIKTVNKPLLFLVIGVVFVVILFAVFMIITQMNKELPLQGKWKMTDNSGTIITITENQIIFSNNDNVIDFVDNNDNTLTIVNKDKINLSIMYRIDKNKLTLTMPLSDATYKQEYVREN